MRSTVKVTRYAHRLVTRNIRRLSLTNSAYRLHMLRLCGVWNRLPRIWSAR